LYKNGGLQISTQNFCNVIVCIKMGGCKYQHRTSFACIFLDTSIFVFVLLFNRFMTHESSINVSIEIAIFNKYGNKTTYSIIN